jgi:dTMP kinase
VEGVVEAGARPGTLAGLSAVVRIRPFRRLWLVLGLSALGDWLGLLATAAFASAQVSGSTAKGLAFGSVISVQLLPALILGPVAGVVADRFDRRTTMVIVDVARFALFASIPAAGLLLSRGAVVVAWATVAMFLVQAGALLWVPAKEAAVPNLLPRGALETANQLTLVTTYGVTPVLAALTFAGMARLPRIGGRIDPTYVALWFDALTFLASALVVYFGIREISGRSPESTGARRPGMLHELVAGARFVAGTPLVRGLVVGVLGAFAGAGVVIGTAKFYAQSLGGGNATFAILFAALFAGFGVGIVAGPRVVGPLSRRRWFALSIVLAGLSLAALAAAPRLNSAALGAFVVGAGAGMAFLSGITLLGGDVADQVRGRVFAFVQTAVRATLMLAISAAGTLAGIGSSRRLRLGSLALDVSIARVLLFVAGACGVLIGVAALRQMDDRPGVPVLRDLWAALRRRPAPAPGPAPATPRRRWGRLRR